MCVSTKSRSFGSTSSRGGLSQPLPSSSARDRGAGVFSDARAGASTKARRASTVACAADGPAQVYILGAIALAALSPELKLELALLSMRYMSHRLDHVANRIWETRCVSI